MIDRRVKIIERKKSLTPTIVRVSELRDYPKLVLLGEPGIGKTTVLRTEAAADKTEIVTVRTAAHGFGTTAGAPLYLDALDEFRADGGEADKIFQVAKLIRDLAPPRWRLTCRAEDWRAAADSRAMVLIDGVDDVTIAQILPLSLDETHAVLAAMGERDPAAFVDQARRVGAAGLLESPLSLDLLHRTVIGEASWPTSRMSLFTQATRLFTYEHDPAHAEHHGRSLPADIADTAERIALVTLTTGVNGVWRSQAVPPSDAVPTTAFGLADTLVGDTLDTPLFVPDNGVFKLMHRSVAEFLAARGLARAVRGDNGRAAIPLGRALALITGSSGQVPTELRGVHAWLGAHLADQGDAVRAGEIVDRDPLGVLAYGDAAVFDHETRQRLFDRLDERDPYFMASSALGRSTALGGLAGDDMTSAFLVTLDGPGDTHKLSVVFDILQHGRPAPVLAAKLREIALDEARPEWQRGRAIDVLLAGDADDGALRGALIQGLTDQPRSIERETLRAKLYAGLPAGVLGRGAVQALLADFIETERDSTVLRLCPLQLRLKREPMPDLFDAPLETWLPNEDLRRNSIEVGNLLDTALAAAIDVDDGSDVPRVWAWLRNARTDVWERLGGQGGPAIKRWIEKGSDRPILLFDAILADAQPHEHPATELETFAVLAGHPPGQVMLTHLTARADAAETVPVRDRLAATAIELARSGQIEPDSYFSVYRWAEARGDRALVDRLTTTVPTEQCLRKLEKKRAHAVERAAAHKRVIEGLRPELDGIAAGSALSTLSEMAMVYMQPIVANADMTGDERLLDVLGPEGAAAAKAGFEQLRLADVPVDARALGAADAQGRTLLFENPLLVGLLRALDDEQ